LKNKPGFGNTALTRIATLGFLGYSPLAPGTAGSLFALLVYLLIDIPAIIHFMIIAAGMLLGIYASAAAEKTLKEKDSKKIVIDEFIGFYVSVFYLPKTLSLAVAAFLLFRFFDILKPLFISKLEKTLDGGLGIMADDVLAGIYTNLVLQIGVCIMKTYV
jgi:phosphatidylglycerophosphatase A